jgi:hypothetical protein
LITISLKKQLEHVAHQPTSKPAQKQDEQQVQPMGNELVNAPSTNATQRGKSNEQRHNAIEPVVRKDPIVFSTIHQATPQTSTQLWCRNPTLAKCGGETQHFQSWGFGVLRDSRMFRARQQGPKHLALRCSWCHWKGLEV